jgi:TRAP-type C4-dicarboxylate transport system permease small subunit
MTKLQDDLDATDEELPHVRDEPVPLHSGLFGRAVDAIGIVFALCFAASTVIILYEVLMRKFLNAPTLWAHDTTIFLCGVAFAFSGLYALARDKHIRVVLLYDKVQGPARRALDVVLSSIGLITVLFFAWGAWAMAERSVWAPTGEIRLETTGSSLRLPYPGLLKAFLFLVVCAMVIQFVVHIVNHARGRSGRPPER